MGAGHRGGRNDNNTVMITVLYDTSYQTTRGQQGGEITPEDVTSLL